MPRLNDSSQGFASNPSAKSAVGKLRFHSTCDRPLTLTCTIKFHSTGDRLCTVAGQPSTESTIRLATGRPMWGAKNGGSSIKNWECARASGIPLPSASSHIRYIRWIRCRTSFCLLPDIRWQNPSCRTLRQLFQISMETTWLEPI
jgi:hypothetical protein